MQRDHAHPARSPARSRSPAASSHAVTLRVSDQGDVQSMDPHSLNESLQLSFTGNVYEPLVERDKEMALDARAGHQVDADRRPTVWRFDLRQGVKFHDGTPFTADDVVFTFKRAAGDGSDMKGYTNPIKEVRKVGDFAVEIETTAPYPILPDTLTTLAHDEQEVVRGEQGRAPGRPPQGHREHRQLQGQRHRPVPPEGAPAVGAHGARAATSTTGARSRATSTRSSSRRSATTRRASRRCSRARPT